MKRWSALAGLAVAAIVLQAGPAQAKPIAEGGMTVKEVADWLHDAGYKAEIKHPKEGDAYVETAAQGLLLSVYLDDCKAERCASLEFWMSFEMKGELAKDDSAAAVKMEEWNRTKRWSRAYADKGRDPILEMDFSLSPGGTTEALDDAFATFQAMSLDFKKFIGW